MLVDEIKEIRERYWELWDDGYEHEQMSYFATRSMPKLFKRIDALERWVAQLLSDKQLLLN
jgi:hypothetical protein